MGMVLYSVVTIVILLNVYILGEILVYVFSGCPRKWTLYISYKGDEYDIPWRLALWLSMKSSCLKRHLWVSDGSILKGNMYLRPWSLLRGQWKPHWIRPCMFAMRSHRTMLSQNDKTTYKRSLAVSWSTGLPFAFWWSWYALAACEREQWVLTWTKKT